VVNDLENQDIVASVMRSFQRPQAQGMTTRFLAGVREVDVMTRSGLFVQRRTAL
jgi:hypothetical protein